MTQPSKLPQTPILFLLASFPTISALLATPSLPNMVQSLGISPSQAQSTITFFLLGYAFGNLPYGPLSKKYGRKPIIYLGAFLTILGALMIALTYKTGLFSLILLGRLLMGLGSGVGLKMSYTIIGDVYDHKAATKVISVLMYAFAIIPAIGMTLGGFLTEQFGWESCYFFLAAYSLFILILSSFLPETSGALDRHALNISNIYHGYARKLRNKPLIACGLIMGAATSIPYVFSSKAPFIGISTIGLNPGTYGLLSWIPPIGIIGGSLLSRYLVDKKHPLALIKLGALTTTIAATLMLTAFLLGITNPWTLFIPAPFIYVGFSLAFSQASALALSVAKDKSNASAIMHFLNMGGAMVSLVISQSLPTRDAWMMPGIFIGLMLFIFAMRQRLTALLKNLKGI